MNLPNKLTVARIILVPFCMFFIAFTGMNDTAARIIALVLFSLTSLTDMLDGKIARKYNLITDFGKFLDPVADKLLIIGSYLAILVRYRENAVFTQVMFWCLFVIFFRELGVTSLRMIVADKVVIAANWMGKLQKRFRRWSRHRRHTGAGLLRRGGLPAYRKLCYRLLLCAHDSFVGDQLFQSLLAVSQPQQVNGARK